jgi:hypothetical protein
MAACWPAPCYKQNTFLQEQISERDFRDGDLKVPFQFLGHPDWLTRVPDRAFPRRFGASPFHPSFSRPDRLAALFSPNGRRAGAWPGDPLVAAPFRALAVAYRDCLGRCPLAAGGISSSPLTPLFPKQKRAPRTRFCGFPSQVPDFSRSNNFTGDHPWPRNP